MRKRGPNTRHSLHGSSALIFLLRLLPSAAIFAVFLLFGRMLPKEANGIYQKFWTFLLVITAFTCAGLQAFAFSFTGGQLAGLLRQLRAGHLLLYGLWVAAGGAVFVRLLGGEHPVWLLFGTVLVFTLSALAESYLTIQRSFALLLPVNALYAAVFVGVHYRWVATAAPMTTLFTAVLLLGALRLLVFLGAAWRYQRRTDSEPLVRYHSRSVRSLWLHLGLYDLVQQLFKYIDRVAAVLLMGEALYAVYAIGATEVPFVPVLLGAVSSAGLMQMKRGGGDADPVKVARQSAMLLASVVFPLFLALYLFRAELVLLVLPQYADSIPILAVSLFTLPLRAYGFTGLLQHFGKVRTINLGAVLDLALALALMVPFYRLWGAPGLAFGIVCSTWAQAVFYLIAGAQAAGTSPLRLLPLRNWLFKILSFLALFVGLRLLVAHHLPDVRVQLLLDGALLVTLTSISLLTDIRHIRKHGSDATPGTAQ